ncbi:MAG: hypothetical protein RhofKO_29870 [Rhodothermales bacterium]
MFDQSVGEFEELVLLSILGLDEAFAVAIRTHILETGQRPATLGGVYRALSRLERKGMVRSRLGAVTRKKGGKRKRLYEVTPAGIRAIQDMRMARERLWAGLRIQPS